MKKNILIILLLIILLCLLLSFLIFTNKILIQPPVLIYQNPKVTFILGKAWYRKAGAERWKAAIVSQKLKYGFEVKTDVNSEVDIRFHADMAVRITENSILKIDDISIRKVQIELEKGSLYGKFEKLFTDYDITIKTPTAIAAVRGTELAFEILEEPQGKEKHKTKIHREKKNEEDTAASPLRLMTVVYSLSGITELYNPAYEDQKILLSYQNKLLMKENEPPGNPEKMTDDEILKIRSKLNSIHTEEVLFISDKINFKVGSATILPNSYKELDNIVTILKEKKVRIRIEGHTDIQGTSAFNQMLSVKRAKSIKAYFIKKGIDPAKLEITGYGSSKPIASNRTAKGRSLNRRVEFIVIE